VGRLGFALGLHNRRTAVGLFTKPSNKGSGNP
jgi:hypothetical protein